ncbi:hypothetical protein VNO77_41683 [Canavalia gladiata]|uniref:Uncharacterized protein n=1 Tax=Canavalia gladiata TaxID=3824 RepID=A0AAN9PSP5_CANGL
MGVPSLTFGHVVWLFCMSLSGLRAWAFNLQNHLTMEVSYSFNNGLLVDFLEKANTCHTNPAVTLILFVTRFEIFYTGFHYVFRLISLLNIELKAMFLGYMSCMQVANEFCSIYQGPRTHNLGLKGWIEQKLPYPFWCCLDADQAETKDPKEQDMEWLGNMTFILFLEDQDGPNTLWLVVSAVTQLESTLPFFDRSSRGLLASDRGQTWLAIHNRLPFYSTTTSGYACMEVDSS